MERCTHTGRYSTSQWPGPLAVRQDAEGTWPPRVCEVCLLGHFPQGWVFPPLGLLSTLLPQHISLLYSHPSLSDLSLNTKLSKEPVALAPPEHLFNCLFLSLYSTHEEAVTKTMLYSSL